MRMNVNNNSAEIKEKYELFEKYHKLVKIIVSNLDDKLIDSLSYKIYDMKSLIDLFKNIQFCEEIINDMSKDQYQKICDAITEIQFICHVEMSEYIKQIGSLEDKVKKLIMNGTTYEEGIIRGIQFIEDDKNISSILDILRWLFANNFYEYNKEFCDSIVLRSYKLASDLASICRKEAESIFITDEEE